MTDREPLPRIVRFLGTDDSAGSSCPHCGATGRYIHRFIVEDGRTLAAMSGCVKLFPVSAVANEEHRLRKKEREYAKKNWTLNRDDQNALTAIADFYAGTIDETAALRECKRARESSRTRAMLRYRR